jgi:hypothetical protein
MVIVYHTRSTTPKELRFVICVLCIVGGKNGAPPSVNTMQFFYRLLVSKGSEQGTQKRAKCIEMWCIHYVCRGHSPYRNFLSKQYRIRSTYVAVAAFESSELWGSHIGVALGSSGLQVQRAVTSDNQSPQNSTPVSRKNFVLHRAYCAFHTVCSQCSLQLYGQALCFLQAATNLLTYVFRPIPELNGEVLAKLHRWTPNPRSTLFPAPIHLQYKKQFAILHICWCNMFHWTCTCICHSSRNVFRQIHSLFKSGYSTECHLVRPLSIIHPLVSLESSSSCLLLLYRPLVTNIFFRP